MQLKKLNTSFYRGNPIVKNALDYYALDSKWDTTKERGHGVVKITINDLTFAIPVRSHVTHNASLILEVMIYAELSGDFPLGDSRQPTYKSLRPFDLVS